MNLDELEKRMNSDLAENIQQPDVSPDTVLKLIAVVRAATTCKDKTCPVHYSIAMIEALEGIDF